MMTYLLTPLGGAWGPMTPLEALGLLIASAVFYMWVYTLHVQSSSDPTYTFRRCSRELYGRFRSWWLLRIIIPIAMFVGAVWLAKWAWIHAPV